MLSKVYFEASKSINFFNKIILFADFYEKKRDETFDKKTIEKHEYL